MYFFFHYTKHVYACMHAYKKLPKLGAKRLGGKHPGGNRIGGETTRVWGTKRPRVKIEAKRLGGKRLVGETTCYRNGNPSRKFVFLDACKMFHVY